MRRADIIRAAAREIVIPALFVIVLLFALAQQRPERACANAEVEARP